MKNVIEKNDQQNSEEEEEAEKCQEKCYDRAHPINYMTGECACGEIRYTE